MTFRVLRILYTKIATKKIHVCKSSFFKNWSTDVSLSGLPFPLKVFNKLSSDCKIFGVSKVNKLPER